MAIGPAKRRPRTRSVQPRSAATSGMQRPAAPSATPAQCPLYMADDHGAPVTISPRPFAPEQRGGGWGPFAESFVKLNQQALDALDTRVLLTPAAGGMAVQLVPGGRAGAVPLRSAQTGRVVGGFLVRPRFGWSGVGRVLAATGWHAMPEFVDLPMVPGSGREIPPWVLAGPVLARLESLVHNLRRGYQEVEATRSSPRGRILWPRYATASLARGRWEQLPCRFWDLNTDPRLRQHLRWTLQRLRQDLLRVGGQDPVATDLTRRATRLDAALGDVVPFKPRPDELRHGPAGGRFFDAALRQGLEAMAWVVEERGLGGGRERDGLSWSLPLDKLWEGYVEAVIRREAALTGGQVKVGRLGETTVPLHWTDPIHRTLGHLVPDIVVRHGRAVHIVDAKYKAHLAELDEIGWRRFTEETRDAHRADLHQVLAYAALFDAEEVTATLVYPLRAETYRVLRERGRDVSAAEVVHHGRRVRLELRGLGFGGQYRDNS